MQFKDSILLKTNVHHAFTAVRHGNGRDWWLIVMTSGTHEIITILVSENGIEYKNPPQINPYAMDPIAGGQVIASPDGNTIAWYAGLNWIETGGVWSLANFDRCTGLINIFVGKIIPQPIGIAGAIEFSPDNNYLYVSNGEVLWQYDLTVTDIIESEIIVASKDSFRYEIVLDFWSGVNFCTMKLGPDGRIYIFPGTGGGYYFIIMEFPNKSGADVQVRQHAIRTPFLFSRTVPNMPNFRLGPLDGSPCDTLGLDNHPIAKYRYDADTLDHLRFGFTDLSYFRPETWLWDFGDGSPISSMRHPVHTFTKNGTYTVCLTVSNENSTNTTCRTITIGTSSTKDDYSIIADINLFPNPVEDLLLITIGNYIPEHGVVQLFDMMGRPVHTQRVFYSHNSIDLTRLKPGTYVWRITDKGHFIKSGKVVKI